MKLHGIVRGEKPSELFSKTIQLVNTFSIHKLSH
nr:MAG TPA: hypothetical protein [Caudoviricetes sp.]